jgi:ABC-2 type transport system permease protein
MSHRVWSLWRKDLALGPRSPLLLYVLVLPLLVTLVVQVVFGNLGVAAPRLGVVAPDAGPEVVAALLAMGMRVTLIDEEAHLLERVERNSLTAGLLLPPGFAVALRAGEQPPLRLVVAGESLASDRVLVTMAVLDWLRRLDPRTPALAWEVIAPGPPQSSLQARLLPFVVMVALFAAGVFVTSFSLADEREKGTLAALLASPMSVAELLLAKGLFGGTLAFVMGVVTLALQGSLRGDWLPMLPPLLVGAWMAALIGVLYGVWARDTKTLFALFKSLNLVVFAPALFYIFPEWPRAITALFPTYWVIDPLVALALHGADLSEVAGSLAVAVGLCLALTLWLASWGQRLRSPHGA